MIAKKFVTHRREPFFELARPYITADAKVLDVGPGGGDFAGHFGRNDFFMLEGNAESADKLLTSHPNTVQGYLPTLPFPDKFFDLIHCSHVVEHLQPQEFYDTLQEMDRCLKIGGTLLISAPLMWEGFYNDLSHVRPYTPTVFRRYLCDFSSKSRTRNFISSDYTIERIQYRYWQRQILDEFDNSRNNIVIKGLFFMARVAAKLGLKRYEKTGYSIILKKRFR